MAGRPKAGHGKGTRKTGGATAATPAKSSTASRSRRAGAVHLSPLDRVARARRVAAARSKQRPDSWPTIAKREGISEKTARRVYDDWLTWRGRRAAPEVLIDDTLDTIEAALLELDDVILAATKAGNLNARVGAVRLMLEAVAGRWDVMRAAGLVRPNMARWQEGQENRAIWEAMIRVLKRHDVGQEVLDELLEVVPDTIDGQATEKLPAAA